MKIVEILRGAFTRRSRRVVETAAGAEVRVGVQQDLEGHLKELVSFAQGDYKFAHEKVQQLIDCFVWLQEGVSGIEGEVEGGRDALVNTKTEFESSVNKLRGVVQRIRNGIKDGQDISCLLDEATELVEKGKRAAKKIKQASAELEKTAKAVSDTTSKVSKVVAESKKTLEDWRSAEQDLVMLAERSGVFVSTTTINNVAERFMESANRQRGKIRSFWTSLLSVVAIGIFMSWFLLKDIDVTLTTLPSVLLLRTAVLGGTATLIIIIHRAIRSAEQERQEYEMKSNNLASSMAVHKESLSAPLQRIIAEELGWKASLGKLGLYLQDDNIIYVENLLGEDIDISGYEVSCLDKQNRRMANYIHQITEETLAGYERTPTIELENDVKGGNVDDIKRVELRDTERVVVARWSPG